MAERFVSLLPQQDIKGPCRDRYLYQLQRGDESLGVNGVGW